MFFFRAPILSIISKRYCGRAVDGHKLEMNEMPAPSEVQKYISRSNLFELKPEHEDDFLSREESQGTACPRSKRNYP